ncbi:MAG: CtsR family transcriptional regulator, partial [Eubacteriales bacterium]|nr:CtsR family transcriptional regulator [Eubacteriales bacterium]
GPLLIVLKSRLICAILLIVKEGQESFLDEKAGVWMRLSDTIAQFIKEMLSQDELEIELQRNDLAAYFQCAPSQINYVLSTRFTPDHGYVTESRRGGGGCIRITRLRKTGGEYLRYLLEERIGESIDENAADIVARQLAERQVISVNDANLIRTAISAQTFAIPIPSQLKDALRARIFRNMLLSIAKRDPQED